MRRLVCALFSALAVTLSLPVSVGATVNRPQSSAPIVIEIPVTGPVDPLTARAFKRGLRRADAVDAALVLVRIDTPGGLASSMREIIQAIAASNRPVVCWVGPTGSRAASAGAIILLGCPVAAMAPGTNTGAAHPVGYTGDILSEKVTNDAAAYARSLAERTHRDPAFAESAVRDSTSISAKQALARGVIDLITPNERTLLVALRGRQVSTARGSITLPALEGARIETSGQTLGEGILHAIDDPNIAFIFFLVGMAGLVFEALHPGLSIPGVVGVLLLVTSLIVLGMLPVNVGGLLLLAASIVFFAIDLHAPGTGLATAAGTISLVLGGLFLFDASVPNARVSRVVIGVVAAGVTLFFALVAQAVVKARRMPAAPVMTIGPGTQGVIVRACDPAGILRAQGEDWSAVADGPPVAAGESVYVTSVEGLTIHVAALGARPRQGEKR